MDALAQLKTALAGRYDIEREIGRGGMATVYLARDVKHNRRVALKVLDPELGAVLGVERFLSEIQVTAKLQHPNLLPLFDSGEADGLLFYVMPLVEGESLRARLSREKQLPLDKAIHIATAVSSALDYAHRHGVIHRDLKPENILLHEGQAMVADFGIALAVSNAGGSRITQTGLSLGTPHYMSPEQATGDRAIDGRTDVYSLGAVTYEMLTGEPPHSGTTAQAIIAKVITDKPRSIRLTRDTVPVYVEAAVEKALAKLPADRFATAHDFAEAILGKSVVLPRNVVTPSSLRSGRKPLVRRLASAWYVWLPWLALAVLAGVYAMRPNVLEMPTARFNVALPVSARILTGVGGFLEMSPTGDGFVYAGQSASGPQLFLRSMDDPQVKPIPGTENGVQPFMSPDGEWVGFLTEGKLKKVALRGGSAQLIADLGTISPTGFAWGRDNRIVLGRIGGGLMQVSATGGTPTPFTQLDSGETSHRGVSFLSDGRTVTFITWRTSVDDAQIAFATLDGRVTRTSRNGVKSRELAGGCLVFSDAQGSIFGARFDPTRFEIGDPVPLVSDVYVRSSGFSAWGLSLNGSLLILRGEPAARLMLVDRTGAPQSLGTELKSFAHPRVSPDGSRIALHVGSGSGGAAATDIWVYQRSSQTLSRLTFGGGNTDPLWSKDGTRLVFSGRAEKTSPENDLYWQAADGSGPAELIFKAPGRQWAYGWSADGRSLVLDELAQGSYTRISALRIGDTVSAIIVRAPPGAVTRLPSLSPDSRWLAYTSNESGRMEVYVTQVPGPGGKWQVSTNGGDQPIWSRSGRELFYRDPASIVAARVVTSPSFAVVRRNVLFEDTYLRSNSTNWDVMPDDQRFVMLKAADETSQIVVVTNWTAEVRRRLQGTPR